MTAILTQTERRRQDRSALCAEKRRGRARKMRIRGQITRLREPPIPMILFGPKWKLAERGVSGAF
jgi:hypothetical protein